ncbi:MAG: hypothetical protein JWQ00_1382 [Noviherbaspirillum sp.]|nr:hypothetical protein [Noviherbaspirillum sp.]
MTASITFTPATTYFILANVALLLLCIGWMKFKSWREQKRTAVVTESILQYFRITGIEVSAKCISLEGNHHFIAFIQSEPMKRFRLSYLVEMSLREHIEKACNMELDTVYWRFIIKDGGPENDNYVRDALLNEGSLRHGSSYYTAEEAPFEAFEETMKMSHRGASPTPQGS